MKERDDSKPLDGEYIQADDAYWGGKKNDGKRGRGATGKIPFVAAVSLSDKGHPIAIRFSQVGAFSKEAIKAWAQQHLTPKRNVVTDGLECFTAFKESSHYHIAFITGGGPESVKMPEFCYRFNRRFDLRQMIARFGYIAVRTTPAPQRLLKVAELCG